MDSEIFINYLIEAEPVWYLRRGEGSEQKRILSEKLFKAMATAKHIKSLDIYGGEYSYEEFCLFLDCLRQNESIKSLVITCYSSEEDRDRTVEVTNRLLTTLANRRIGLVDLDIPWGPIYDDIGHLVELIRSNPDLKSLRLCGSFTDDDVAAILNQLRESCENLVSLYISGQMTFDGLCHLADFAGQSRVVQSVKSSTELDIEVTNQQMNVLKNRLGEGNKKLIEFNAWYNPTKLEVIERNKELAAKEREKEKSQKYLDWRKQHNESRVEYVPEANYDLTKFPSELMFSLLVHCGVLSSISAFFKTCKHWRSCGQKSNFWKHLVAHVMPEIEPEDLELAEVYYAEHVQKYGIENSNFWAILLKRHYANFVTSPAQWAAVGITDITAPNKLPFHHPQPSPLLHEQLLTALYRRYPGLTASTHECEITTSAAEGPHLHLHLCYGQRPYFQIVIRTFNNKKVTGIFFVSDYKKDWLQYNPTAVVYLDYFSAESLDEALVKSKRMIETLYVTADRWVYHSSHFSASSLLLLRRAEENHTKLREQINDTINTVAERIIAQFNIDGSKTDPVVQLTQLVVNQLRTQSMVSNADLLDKKQKLPPRNTLHKLYPENVLKEVSFISAQLNGVRGEELPPISPQPKKKSRNSSLKGTLMKGIRVMVNFIVMPVLQALWPRHVREMDQGHSTTFTLPDGLYNHYYTNFQPFTGVTVDNAAPKCWPMTALVIASQISEQVGTILEQLVGLHFKQIKKEDVKLDKLIELLSAYENLIPPKHVAGFQDVVKRILEFS